jgi:hypothetical protein
MLTVQTEMSTAVNDFTVQEIDSLQSNATGMLVEYQAFEHFGAEIWRDTGLRALAAGEDETTVKREA